MSEAQLQSHFVSNSVAETILVGAYLGEALRAGDCVAIRGRLGAGKTVIVQGILQGLGIHSFQGSPTFVLVHPYRLPELDTELLHIDAYRLGPQATEQWLQLGWEEWLAGDKIVVVEWADYVAGILPEDRLELNIAIPTETNTNGGNAANGEQESMSIAGSDTRKMALNALGVRSVQLLQALKERLQAAK